MIFLRCIAFLIGGLIVMGAPFFLLSDRPQQANDVAAVMMACGAIALFASGFFCIGVAGHHMRRSPRTRMLAGVLLAFPILGSMAALLFEAQWANIWMVFPLFFCAGFMFVSFVYPARHHRAHTRMRPREPADSVKR